MFELFGSLFIVFIIIGFAFFAFWIWMLIDCISNEPSIGNDKIIWVLVILILQWVGALPYFFIRRPQRIGQFGR
jgi:Phospholipase_D-nuclease N-terminal